MSKIIAISALTSMKVAALGLSEINPIIFSAKVVPTIPGLTNDGGKFYQLDTVKNTAVEVTPAWLTDAAKTAIMDGEVALAATLAENYGMVTTVDFEFDAELDLSCAGSKNLLAAVESLGMKVAEAEVAVQNDIIFGTKVVGTLADLVKKGSDYYSLDLKNNTATIVNPEALAKQAVDDLVAGKNSEAVQVAVGFKLIRTMKLVKKTDDQ